MALKNLPPEAKPREKLAARGAAALSDTELLAIVLRTGMAGKGVLQLARELLELPGRPGLAGLLQADHADLRAIKGLGPAKCAQLVAVLELARYLQLHLAGRAHEVFAVLFLDCQHRLIALEEMFRGTLARTSVYPKEVVLRALHHHAGAVILAHNHPSGHVQASAADRALTQSLQAALALVDIQVLDHVIVAPGAALSMAGQGWI
jgi:DNA repair protein RadC